MNEEQFHFIMSIHDSLLTISKTLEQSQQENHPILSDKDRLIEWCFEKSERTRIRILDYLMKKQQEY
jgi:hypothetical protein